MSTKVKCAICLDVKPRALVFRCYDDGEKESKNHPWNKSATLALIKSAVAKAIKLRRTE